VALAVPPSPLAGVTTSRLIPAGRLPPATMLLTVLSLSLAVTTTLPAWPKLTLRAGQVATMA